MSFHGKAAKPTALYRLNTRIEHDQADYIKAEVKKSKGELTDGDVVRALLAEAISNRKKK